MEILKLIVHRIELKMYTSCCVPVAKYLGGNLKYMEYLLFWCKWPFYTTA